MAHCDKAFNSQNDDYMTERSAWDNIKHIIPKNKIIYEGFYGDGTSGTILSDLGFEVIHEDIDFFKNTHLGDIVVSNPPFTMKKEVLKTLFEADKPFILILPQNVIFTQYFRKMIIDLEEKPKLIVPKKRIQFLKMVNGEVDLNQKKQCSFDCYYICWKIEGLERDITWLD